MNDSIIRYLSALATTATTTATTISTTPTSTPSMCFGGWGWVILEGDGCTGMTIQEICFHKQEQQQQQEQSHQ